jgi:hypothetical protein
MTKIKRPDVSGDLGSWRSQALLTLLGSEAGQDSGEEVGEPGALFESL